MNILIDKINELKKEKNAVILAHCYQNIEIDLVADYVGDSFYLSRVAKDTDADIIVFAGVSFMAETAKLLSPNKKVLLPRLESGCFMADMITAETLREFKNLHPDIPVVCYINSSAEVKAECDVCCTSSNAVEVVKSLNVNEVLFVPDAYLGKWVEAQLPEVKVTTFTGFCPTHLRITTDDISKSREMYPNAKILAHPECHQAVSALADYVGSTKQIMEYVHSSSNDQFVIATEKGVVDRLKRDYPDKEFYLIKDSIICKNMKWHTLDDIYNALLNEEHETFLNESVSENAMNSINKMLDVTQNVNLAYFSR